MRKMTERYDELRRPFDLDEAEEAYPEPPAQHERPPWENPDPFERVPAYAAEDVVEDVEEDEDDEAEALSVLAEEEPEPAPPPARVPDLEPQPEPEPEPEPVSEVVAAEPAFQPGADPEVTPESDSAVEHAPAGLSIPDGYRTLEGDAHGDGIAVAVVVSRFNGEITNGLLERALNELDESGVAKEAVTVVAVPGAFELPLAAMALAKTRRYACVVALGCIIRGETKHFDFISSEAASGLQLAALETGTPVSFGVLTCENREQAEARIDRADDAVRSALEMADMFAKLRAAAG
jgi:6,7-dimethyl-8-ribityllumazine synthase